MNSEAADLHAVGTADRFYGGYVANDFHKWFTFVALLVKIANITRGHFLGERDGDCVVDSLEPYCDVWDEGDGVVELGGDFLFVEMVSKGVRDDVVF